VVPVGNDPITALSLGRIEADYAVTSADEVAIIALDAHVAELDIRLS
jgi:hypothetical protein